MTRPPDDSTSADAGEGVSADRLDEPEQRARARVPSEGTAMGTHSAGTPPGGLPSWVTVVVVLSLTGLLGYNIIVVGPEGLPTSYVLGGLLGAYAGVDQLLKRRADGSSDDQGKG